MGTGQAPATRRHTLWRRARHGHVLPAPFQRIARGPGASRRGPRHLSDASGSAAHTGTRHPAGCLPPPDTTLRTLRGGRRAGHRALGGRGNLHWRFCGQRRRTTRHDAGRRHLSTAPGRTFGRLGGTGQFLPWTARPPSLHQTSQLRRSRGPTRASIRTSRPSRTVAARASDRENPGAPTRSVRPLEKRGSERLCEEHALRQN